MGERQDRLRAIMCDAMTALAEGRFADADRHFDPDATWWIIGQGDLSHQRVRELAEKTEGPLAVRTLDIIGTVAEDDKVAVEARGAMVFPDGRTYRNAYHHVARFEGERIVAMHEYFDTLYVRDVFGADLYAETT